MARTTQVIVTCDLCAKTEHAPVFNWAYVTVGCGYDGRAWEAPEQEVHLCFDCAKPLANAVNKLRGFDPV